MGPICRANILFEAKSTEEILSRFIVHTVQIDILNFPINITSRIACNYALILIVRIDTHLRFTSLVLFPSDRFIDNHKSGLHQVIIISRWKIALRIVH